MRPKVTGGFFNAMFTVIMKSEFVLLLCFAALEDEEEPFVLEDTCVLNTDNMDTHSCDTSSLASSDSGDPGHLKR